MEIQKDPQAGTETGKPSTRSGAPPAGQTPLDRVPPAGMLTLDRVPPAEGRPLDQILSADEETLDRVPPTRPNARQPNSPRTSKVISQPLAMLNAQAQTRTFSLDDLNWALPLNFHQPWIPHAYIAIRYLPAFKNLSHANQLRFNQLTSVALCEQFIWFEKDLLITTLQNLVTSGPVETEMLECIRSFINDEERHAEMFRRLLLKYDPTYYAQNRYRYFSLSFIENWIFTRMTRHPRLLLSWVWIAIFFEERTLHVSRLYRSAELNPNHTVDAVFAKAHALHMIDEARHLQIDQYLLSAFYNPAAGWRKKLSAFFCKRIFGAYRSPKRISRRILEQMIEEEAVAGHEDQVVVLREVIKQLPELQHSASFREAMFGESVMPRTRELMRNYPEMHVVFDAVYGD